VGKCHVMSVTQSQSHEIGSHRVMSHDGCGKQCTDHVVVVLVV